MNITPAVLRNSDDITGFLASKGLEFKRVRCEANIRFCPACHGDTGKSDNQYKLSINIETGLYNCVRCNESGNFLQFQRLYGEQNYSFTPWQRTENGEDKKSRNEKAKRIWRESIPLLEPSAEAARRYLKNRGIAALPEETVARFHQGSPCSFLVFRIFNKATADFAIHRIFITEDGTKAPIDNPKMSLGSCPGGAIFFGKPGDTLHVAEGPETALAICEALKEATCAGVSANGMENLVIPAAVEKIYIWGDLDCSRRGEEAAKKLTTRLNSEGLEVYVCMPQGPIPEGKKGVDWLDVFVSQGAKVIVHAKENAANRFTSTKNPPAPLFRDIPPTSKYPIDALGELLGTTAHRLMHIIRAPDSLCGNSILSAASLAVQGHRNVEIDGRIIPLSLFALTVGESGERKSAVDDEALYAHYQFQEEQSEDYRSEEWKYQIEAEAFKTAKNHVLKKSEKEQRPEIQKRLAELGSEPQPPLQPLLIIEDPTIEGIYKFMSIARPSLGLFTDEGGKLIGGHAFNSDNQLKTLAGLSSLWDGKRKPTSRVRSGEGIQVLYGRRLAMHIMVQPIVVSQLLRTGIAQNQGWLPRCLPAWPDSTVGTRMYRDIDIGAEPIIHTYRERMRAILDLPLPVSEECKNQLEPQPLPLSGTAKTLWVQFHDHIECQIGKEGPLQSIRAFGSKLPEHALRIAGVLACIEDVKTPDISYEVMARGIDLAQYYLNETVRLYQSEEIDPLLKQANELLEWIKRQSEPIYLVKVYQRGPGGIRDKGTAKKLLTILEQHGQIERVTERIEIDGAERKEAWRLLK